MDTIEFAACLQAARCRDESAVAALYDQFALRVHAFLYYRTGNLNEADDLTEDVFLRVLEAIGTCRAQTEASFVAWLFRIARNTVIDWARQQSRRPVVALAEDWLDPSDGPGAQVEQRLSHQQVRRMLADLTDEQREVIVLRFVDGLSNVETAQVLHTSEGAVKALQYRALTALRRGWNE